MLELSRMTRRGGPAPGGPFPRIGAPRAEPPPVTLLGRWLNVVDLPELYQTPEFRPLQLYQQLRVQLGKANDAEVLIRIGDVHCARLDFSSCAESYRKALENKKLPRAVERLRDVERIMRGPISSSM